MKQYKYKRHCPMCRMGLFHGEEEHNFYTWEYQAKDLLKKINKVLIKQQETKCYNQIK